MFKPARVQRRHQWADGLVTLTLDAVGPMFTPGQFFNLALPGEGDKLIRRSYSAASAPGQPLEFIISEVAGGELTPGLFALGEGDELLVDEEGLGFFTLSEVPEARHLWLISTGTGLGPYLSMLRAGEGLTRFERILIVHGVTEPARLVAQAELEAHAQSPGITYIPLTSRSAPPVGGLPGRITAAIEDGKLEEAAGTPLDTDSHVLLCGNPQMIEDATAQLKARGLSKHRRRTPGHFNFEKYWQK